MDSFLYLLDPYAKDFTATVKNVQDKFVVLDKTCFYPQSGGQPADTGTLTKDDEEYRVVFAKKIGGQVSHEVDREGLRPGDVVQGKLDWERRHTLMRYHTAAHILSSLMHQETGAEITGNELYEDRARIDFSLPDFDREFLTGFQEKANRTIAANLPVTIRFVDKEQAMTIPSLVKLRKALPEHIEHIRVITIGDFDQQACGGTHVRNTREIGPLEIYNLENKGKGRKRIYFRLTTSPDQSTE